MYDINHSPVGWYVASYVIRFVETSEAGNDNPERLFDAWENTVIVKASDFDEAHSKVLQAAAKETNPYKGGPEGVEVKWEFLGLTELLPIYEELEDGSEIMYQEHKATPLNQLQAMVKSKADLRRKAKS